MKLRDASALVLAILVSELAGVVGALFTTPAIPGWYAGLAKPALTPPGWVFGPVWTMLFALMGIAAFLVWRRTGSAGIASSLLRQGYGRARRVTPRNDRQVRIALALFLVQLVLNTLWSVIFFGMRNPGAALIELVVLWFAVLATIVVFARVSKPAAWLLAPYMLWVSFAGYLNYAIWRLLP